MDGTVKIWSINNLQQISNDNTMLTANNSSSNDITTKLQHQIQLEDTIQIDHSSSILSACWDDRGDEPLIYIGNSNSQVIIYNISQHKVIMLIDLIQQLNNHENELDYVAYKFVKCIINNPSDITFAVSIVCKGYDTLHGTKGILALYSLKTGHLIHKFQGIPMNHHINTMIFNHNGNMLITACSDGIIRIYDMIQYDIIMEWKAHKAQITHITLSKDENTLWSTSLDGYIMKWSLHRCQLLRKFIIPNINNIRKEPITFPQIAINSNDDYFLLNGSYIDNNALLYSSKLRSSIFQLIGHSGPVTSVAWHPEYDNIILTGSMDHTARLSLIQLNVINDDINITDNAIANELDIKEIASYDHDDVDQKEEEIVIEEEGKSAQASQQVLSNSRLANIKKNGLIKLNFINNKLNIF